MKCVLGNVHSPELISGLNIVFQWIKLLKINGGTVYSGTVQTLNNLLIWNVILKGLQDRVVTAALCI